MVVVELKMNHYVVVMVVELMMNHYVVVVVEEEEGEEQV